MNEKSICCGADKFVDSSYLSTYCSKCSKLFVPASNNANYMQNLQTVACGHCDPSKYGEGLKQAEKSIPNYKCECECHSQPSPDWIDKERKEFWRSYAPDFKQNQEILFENVTNYWLSRIASKIEAAQIKAWKEGYDDRKNNFQELDKEMGRQEERERVVKMIEKIYNDSWCGAQGNGDGGLCKDLKELLTNLRSNE